MKKILALLVAFALLSSAALAAQGGQGGDGMGSPELVDAGQGEGGPVTAGAGQDTGQGNMTQKETRAMEGEGMGAQNREKLQTGLENALGRVTNENARQRLQQNMEKFMNQYQARLEKKMQGVEIEEVDDATGAVTIRAKEQVKFLGFIKGTATKRFEMDDKGNINEKAPWYRFLYAEVKDTEE
jgi:hypothetical protein